MRLKGTAFHRKLQEVANRNGVHIVTWWWTPGAFATKDREITGPKSVAGLKLRAADPTFDGRGIVHLDDERRAAMVSNLMVVLCGEREAQPVVNAGTLYQ